MSGLGSGSKLNPPRSRLKGAQSESPKTSVTSGKTGDKSKLRLDLKANLSESDSFITPDVSSVDKSLAADQGHRNRKKCPCGKSNKSSWKIDCSHCLQEWHADCLSMKGIPKSAINLMIDWLCPFCYVAPIATTRATSDLCYQCRNTLTLQQSNSDFEASTAAANLHSVETLCKSLASIDTDKLCDSLKLVQNLDLHLQHLLVSDQGLEKFQSIPAQIALAVESKLSDLQINSSESVISEQITKLHEQIQTLSTPPQPDSSTPASASATDQLLEKISNQLDQLCDNETTVSSGLNELKQSISSIQSVHTAPFSAHQPEALQPTTQARSPSTQPEPVQHGQKAISDTINGFVDDESGQALLSFLDNCTFNDENGHSVISFGIPYSYSGAKSCTDVPPMPDQLKPLLDKVNQLQQQIYHEKYPNMKNISNSAPPINSCLINKYQGSDSHLPLHSDNEVTIHAESSIFTLSLGQQCSIKFVDQQSKEESVHECPSLSLYHMTRKSQDFFQHCIDRGSISEGIRYSVTFRSINWRNRNSTCIAGDSNTGSLRFGSSKRGSFGELMPGQKFWAPKINDIDPKLCCSYNNVVVLCGINDIRSPSVNHPHDVHSLYNQLKCKVKDIKSLNPKCNLFVCPLLPTKSSELNKKVNCFNERIFNDLTKLNLGVQCVSGFDRFADHTGVLVSELSRTFDRFNNRDMLHLNETGARVLAGLLKRSIFLRLNGGVDRRTGASRLNGVPYSHMARNHLHRGGYGDH